MGITQGIVPPRTHERQNRLCPGCWRLGRDPRVAAPTARPSTLPPFYPHVAARFPDWQQPEGEKQSHSRQRPSKPPDPSLTDEPAWPDSSRPHFALVNCVTSSHVCRENGLTGPGNASNTRVGGDSALSEATGGILTHKRTSGGLGAARGLSP